MYLLNMLALNLVRKILGDRKQFATICLHDDRGYTDCLDSYYGFEAPFLR